MHFTKGNKVSWIDDIKSDLTVTENKVDKACKMALADRCTFEIDSITVGLTEYDCMVILKCDLIEQKWDYENQKLLDEYINKKFEYNWYTDMITIDELAVALYTHCEGIFAEME